MKQTAYNVRFSANVKLSGDLQINATSESDAQNLARSILRQSLNSEDCLIELDSENDNNNITVLEMELLPNITALNIHDAISLE